MESKKAQQKREKTKQKRWGKKFEDKRNWKEYNEKLVKRGELYLSFEFLENWDTELNKMNEDTLDKKEIESGIKTRINASTRSRGSPYRARCIREKEELGGYKGWRDKYDYGKRWLVESVLSAVKRIFGETVRATSIIGMFKETKMKFMYYNILLNCK